MVLLKWLHRYGYCLCDSFFKDKKSFKKQVQKNNSYNYEKSVGIIS